tara:strand:- start:239 stop:2014 length:1776 start_codon:yes stop_codon:yes gene_type:complete
MLTTKNKVLRFNIFLIKILFLFFCYSYVSADSNTIQDGGTETDQQNIDGEGEFLTVKNSSTLATGATTKAANVTGDSVTVTVESGSTISANTVAVFGDTTSDLTVTNSGTITASGTTAIDAKATANATITNNSGGTISSNRNTIRVSKTGGTNTTGMTITNSGIITATNGSAIFGTAAGNTVTITNKVGGEISNFDSDNATIRVGVSSSVTNSGTIKNDVGNDSIKLYGNNSTITLKDQGIVVGKIAHGAGITGSTLKINHGVGQSYYYDIDGDFSLEDLDGNQIVKGSAGSVGQGGSEIIDELLSTKSLDIRQSLTKYKKAEKDLDDRNGWGEINFSTFKRKQNNQDLTLGFNLTGVTLNLINPYKGKDFILSLGSSNQQFTKDHDIKRYSLHSGLYFKDQTILTKFLDENFILAGINIHDSEREILTNTRASGKLSIGDIYESYDLIAGSKINNESLIPNLGTTIGLSYTPSHSERHLYRWEGKGVGNLSIYIDDEYEMNLGKDYNLNLGWILDVRNTFFGKDQDYSINGTKATYSQKNDQTREVTLATNFGFEKNISNDHFLKFSLDSRISTQELIRFSGNLAYKFAF